MTNKNQWLQSEVIILEPIKPILMIKPTFKKGAFKALGLSAFFAFAMTFFGMNTMHAQSASLSEQVNSVDRDYADQFKSAVTTEIQEVRSNPNYGQDEKIVREKILRAAVSNVEAGLEIEDAFTVSYNQLLEKVNTHAPNVNLKNIMLEYKNQFS